MVAAVGVQVSQDRTLAAVGPTPDVQLSQAYTLAVYNFPSAAVQTAQANTLGVVVTSNSIQVSQARTLAVVKGRPYNPKLRAWTFNLDGHPFYVLRLAENKTLIYDLATKQWAWWSSDNQEHWTASIGMNWRTPGANADVYGSNVVAGDDSWGVLWILDPLAGYDEAALDAATTRFDRVAEAQMITRGRGPGLPCYEVYLTASGGSPALPASSVTLSYSDDVGHTYVNAGAITVNPGDYNQEFAWRSLGMIDPPGRIFRIADDGALARIDGLDINNGSTASN